MRSMYLALGYLCNHNCFFCPCGKKTDLPSFASYEDIITAIDQGVKERRIENITLSGGEPTLHPRFNDILKHCQNCGLSIGILSNGETFSDPQKLEQFFAGINPRNISVTTAIHSIFPKSHEQVTCVSGSYNRTIQGLLNIMRKGISVTVKQVISKWNYRDLPEFVDFVYRAFGPRVSITLCGMDFCGMTQDQTAAVAVDFASIRQGLEPALDLVISLRKQFNAFPHVTVADLPLCCVDPYYWGFFTKVSRGDLSQYSAPSKRTGTVSTHVDIQNDCDIFFEDCKRCCVSDNCPGAWRTAFEFFGEKAVKCINPYLVEG